ncbi:hypothetical protein [Diaphorobacter aerolatus]|uniref:Universal stress protein n=1 Tax=Diaphorobacter aerolatus TaxID=1288495 RepID=A0A7H0GGS5_9BURK|nr:hypothetical protein [Diaphorobacter aerolatus]QNP47491.1 hypothetical protein H9K75_14605 [Diaphorobacter aerolatus]
MDTVIVYVDDAEYARQIMQPALQQGESAQTTHWVLVACAPRMTHRISKWVSHSARESWRAKWADKLFAQLLPWLESGNGQVSTVLAKIPLPELLEQLQQQYGAKAQLLDARRPKQEGAAHQQAYVPNPVAEQPAPAAPTVKVKKPGRTWALPGTLAGLMCMMFVTVE